MDYLIGIMLLGKFYNKKKKKKDNQCLIIQMWRQKKAIKSIPIIAKNIEKKIITLKSCKAISERICQFYLHAYILFSMIV